MIGPNDWIESVWKDPSDVIFGSYGLDQCLDLVENALSSGRGLPRPEGEDWLEGTGVALAMLESGQIPTFADVPRSEIYFADTYDNVGPLGAKAQGECAINAVAPAIANAVANATGVRFPDLPLTPDRIFAKLGARS
jgi:putative selenate reductase molybdopterin-binding subunit